jgi:GAF domain-containing protein
MLERGSLDLGSPGCWPVLQRVLETGQSVRLAEIHEHDHDPAALKIDSSAFPAQERRACSVVAVPLRKHDGSAVGVLIAINSSRGSFSEDDERRLESWAAKLEALYHEGKLEPR